MNAFDAMMTLAIILIMLSWTAGYIAGLAVGKRRR